VSLLWTSRVAGTSLWPLAGDFLRVLATFSAPAALAASVSLWLPWSDPVRLLAGVVLALLVMATSWLAVPSVRRDVTFAASFFKRGVTRKSDDRGVR
jgi:hypothetical protein